MTKHLVLIAAALALSACGQQIGFFKPGATVQDQMVAEYECEKDLRVVSYSFGRFDQDAAVTFFMRCMMARGWSVSGARR